jgi:hypothetical protein
VSQPGHIGPVASKVKLDNAIVFLPAMPPGQKSRDQKLTQTAQTIKKCGWPSTNGFIEAFFNSPEAVQSLRYQPNSDYGPDQIISAWMANVPPGDAKTHFNLSITHKAAEITVKESSTAYHNIIGIWAHCTLH